MPDLDFVPAPRPAGTTGTTGTVSTAGATGTGFTPRADARVAVADARPAALARPVALARLDAPRTVDPAAQAAGWAAGYAAGARQAAAEAAEQRAALAAQSAHAEQQRTAEHASVVTALARAAQDLRDRRAPVLDDALDALHAAALELAVGLLGVELSDASTAARAALARVLAAGALPDDVVVHLHPRDAAALAAAGDEVGVTVVPDASLAPGDALAVHAEGLLDARLDAAVARVRTALGER